jgi:hypothetical protein
MSANEFGLLDTDPHNKPLTPVEKCEVSNLTSLARYRKKRAQWLGWYQFRKEDPNSIEGQIIGMTFLDMSYRILAKPRRNTEGAGDIAARNGLLAHVLDQGYAATQVLAIRRLLDKGSSVISVQRLLSDIQKSRDLITRENYVAYDGKPYDPDGWASLPPSAEAQIWGVEAPGFHPWLMSGVRHNLFDKLSGVSRTNRSRSDKIAKTVFEKLQARLRSVEAEKLITFSHKFFAHAADMSTRGTLTYSGVLLSDLEAAQKAIVRVERAITDDLLMIGVAREVVAMEPLGFLKSLDAPYVGKETLAKMDAHWKELKDERNSWSKGYEGDLYS